MPGTTGAAGAADAAGTAGAMPSEATVSVRARDIMDTVIALAIKTPIGTTIIAIADPVVILGNVLGLARAAMPIAKTASKPRLTTKRTNVTIGLTPLLTNILFREE